MRENLIICQDTEFQSSLSSPPSFTAEEMVFWREKGIRPCRARDCRAGAWGHSGLLPQTQSILHAGLASEREGVPGGQGLPEATHLHIPHVGMPFLCNAQWSKIHIPAAKNGKHRTDHFSYTECARVLGWGIWGIAWIILVLFNLSRMKELTMCCI